MTPEEIIARQQGAAAATTAGAAEATKRAFTFVATVASLYLLYRWLR